MAVPEQLVEALELKPVDTRDPYLRQAQRNFDQIYFDKIDPPYSLELVEFPDGSRHPHEIAKVAHVGIHVGKALAKMNGIKRRVHPTDSPLLHKEIMPDVLIYRTQLANTLGFNLKRHFDDADIPVEPAKSRFETAVMRLEDAHGVLVYFYEPLEHAPANPHQLKQVRKYAIPALHAAGVLLGKVTRTDPKTAHAERLLHNIKLSTEHQAEL